MEKQNNKGENFIILLYYPEYSNDKPLVVSPDDSCLHAMPEFNNQRPYPSACHWPYLSLTSLFLYTVDPPLLIASHGFAAKHVRKTTNHVCERT